jgi:hypothetical protein
MSEEDKYQETPFEEDEEYISTFECDKPIIYFPGLVPEITRIVLTYLNPNSLALSKINKGFKMYFYYYLNQMLRQFNVRHWVFIFPPSYKFTGLLHKMKLYAKYDTYIKRLDSTPYINFLENMLLKLPESFFSKLLTQYPETDESNQVFKLCGHSLSAVQLRKLTYLLQKECTLFSKKIPGQRSFKNTICDMIFDEARGIIDYSVYKWPDTPSEFVKSLFIMHYIIQNNGRGIKKEDFPEWMHELYSKKEYY